MRQTRRAGAIPKLKRDFRIENVLYFDTETKSHKTGENSSELTLWLGYAIYNHFDKSLTKNERRTARFYSADEFMDFMGSVIKPGKTLYVFAHNLQFDLQVLDLVDKLNEAGFNTDLPLLSPFTFIWHTRFRDTPVVFIDSMNIFQVSLERLGKDIGLPKIGIDLENAPISEVLDYCARDVEILETAFSAYYTFLSDNGLGYFSHTISWQAMTAFRTRFMTKNIMIHTDYQTLRLEREAYHGGRVECFYLGTIIDKMHFLIDVNSMYPTVMTESPMPIELISRNSIPTLRNLKSAMTTNYVIARVIVETGEAAYPMVKDKTLLFPIGKFECCLHHAELKYALEQGHIVKVLEMAQYKQAYLFDEYVDFFFEVKRKANEKGDKSTERMAKMFLNALPGKFGQRNTLDEYLGPSDIPGVFVCNIEDLVTHEHFSEYHWFGKRYLSAKIGERPYSFPAISGAICAGARMKLWAGIKQAGAFNCLYCDTDSLIVNQHGLYNLKELLNDTHLGKFRLVDMSDNLQIFGPKDYRFGQSIKIKGFKSGSLQIGDNTWKVTQFRSFRKAIKQGELGKVRVYQILKRRMGEYKKGVAQNGDGWTRPLEF